MNEVNTLDILFIRACKVQNPRQRLQSLYRRFYYNCIGDSTPYVISILAKICEAHSLFTTIGLINSLNPTNSWKYTDSHTFEDIALGALISKIRNTKASAFPGFISPAMFKNKIKEI